MAQRPDGLIPRRLMDVAAASLADFRVLVIHGARQVGKSTLALALAQRHGAAVVSLDNADDLAAARNDPPAFLDVLGTPLVIDEIQRVGEPLVLAMKVVVDRDTRPGRYILTGSSNFLTVPTISESLAGRVDITALWPLSQGELAGGADEFVDRGFRGIGQLLGHQGPTPERDHYFDRLCTGGYRAVQGLSERASERARRRWFDQYVDTVLRREIEVAGDIRRAGALADMVRYFASMTGQELVLSTVAQRSRD